MSRPAFTPPYVLPPREIARRTGVPVETARTRVKRGVAELRAIVDARYRGRHEELLASIAPLVGIALWGAGTGVLGGSKTLGGLLMGAKLKLAAGLGVVALAGLWWAAPWRASPSSPGSEALAPSSTAEHGGALAPAEAGAAASASAVEEVAAPARERRVAKSADTSWVLRGLALRAGREPFPGAEVALRVVAGYSGPGETLHDELVRAGGEGRFELALPPPASAVRVIVTPRAEGFAGFASETLVLRDAPAPQELRANFHPLDLVLRGRVLQPDRRPARGAELRVHGRARACDAEGRWDTRGEELAPGRVIGLEIRAEGDGPAVVPRAITAIDATESPIVVELGPALALRG